MKIFKNYQIFALCLVFSISVFLPLISSQKTNAVTGADWNASRIIDDSIFFNSNIMSSQEIQSFLNAKVPSCDTYGSKPISSGSSTTRAQWAAANGKPQPPYTCLKDFVQNIPGIAPDTYCTGSVGAGTKSAATIIKEVAVACNINPQVILVTLQKEQSFITDDWPWPIQYTKATGMGCPDSSLGTDVDANQNGCYDDYEGFFKQIYYGARQFQRYVKQPDVFNYAMGRNSFVAYQANDSSCGGTYLTPQSQATAALYNYTPYQPNAAALNNMYGTGDGCSAYGNRNFWRMFNDWFGTTIGPNYAWSIESYTYSGGDNIITQGQTETVTLRARNTGRVPWYNHGSHPVRLGTWEPADRYSQLFNTNRLATVQENSVLPNEIGTFTFTITPASLGTFAEGLNLVAENAEWAYWPGFRPTIVVPQAYQWQVQSVIYEKGTGVMDPGTSQLITVIAKNTGSATWSKSSGPPIRLGTWQPQRQSAVGQNWQSTTRVTDMNENTVAPGQTAGYQFYVRMPASGTFYEKINMVAEGQAWFNDAGLTLYLFGTDFAWNVQSISYSSGTGVMAPNSTQTITVQARNTGTSTWYKNGGYPVRLGTWQPQRMSSVAENWLSPTRMANLTEETVSPNQIGTFTAQVKMPGTGVYYERMNIVAEGLKWFNDPGLTFYLEGRNP